MVPMLPNGNTPLKPMLKKYLEVRIGEAKRKKERVRERKERERQRDELTLLLKKNIWWNFAHWTVCSVMTRGTYSGERGGVWLVVYSSTTRKRTNHNLCILAVGYSDLVTMFIYIKLSHFCR